MCKDGSIINYDNDNLALPLLFPVLYGLGLIEKIDCSGEPPNETFELMWQGIKIILLSNEELYSDL